jgi:hypothetical protein
MALDISISLARAFYQGQMQRGTALPQEHLVREPTQVVAMEEHVDASNKTQEIDVSHVKQLFTTWFKSRNTSTVTFKENLTPTPDPDARYQVIYEAIFEPLSLEKAYFEVWVTTDFKIAIGFERHSRISKRLRFSNQKDQFIAGNEPESITEETLLEIMNLIANGEIAISYMTLPLIGPAFFRAVALAENLERLYRTGYSPIWIKPVGQRRSSFTKKLLRFEKW